MSSPLTTHVLDQASGLPAANLEISLSQRTPGGWTRRGSFCTDADGRVKNLLAEGELVVGEWELTFAVGEYFRNRSLPSFYESVPVRFLVSDTSRHHHVPLLVSPYGYSTYRGS